MRGLELILELGKSGKIECGDIFELIYGISLFEYVI